MRHFLMEYDNFKLPKILLSSIGFGTFAPNLMKISINLSQHPQKHASNEEICNMVHAYIKYYAKIDLC